MTRAIRRHHRERLKKSRAHYWGGHASSSPEWSSRVTRTPQSCSCRGCGNQRRYEGPTIQEVRASVRGPYDDDTNDKRFWAWFVEREMRMLAYFDVEEEWCGVGRYPEQFP